MYIKIVLVIWFVLREELRRWFIAQEMELFRYRFLQESDESIEEFLFLNNLNFVPVSVALFFFLVWLCTLTYIDVFAFAHVRAHFIQDMLALL